MHTVLVAVMPGSFVSKERIRILIDPEAYIAQTIVRHVLDKTRLPDRKVRRVSPRNAPFISAPFIPALALLWKKTMPFMPCTQPFSMTTTLTTSIRLPRAIIKSSSTDLGARITSQFLLYSHAITSERCRQRSAAPLDIQSLSLQTRKPQKTSKLTVVRVTH